MKCDQITDRLDEYLDGMLSAAEAAQFQQHILGCASCRGQQDQIQAFKQTLKSLPGMAPVSQEFFTRAIGNATRRTGYGVMQKVAGLAVAASIFGLVLTNFYPGSQDQQLAGVTMTLNETRTVQISLNAERDMQGARLSIRLPDGVEMKGFPGRRVVSWNTDLQRGMNILPLPLVAVAISEGRVVARLEHDHKSKELEVQLNVREPGTSHITVPQEVTRERA